MMCALSVALGIGLTGATTTVSAQPKKAPAKKAPKKPVAPAKEPAPAVEAEAAAPAPPEDPPSPDASGTDENPVAPRVLVDPETPQVTAVAPVRIDTGYPIEEVLRPITLPENTSEVSVAPRMTVSPFASSTALRARYGVTSQIQIGLTYVLAGIYDDPSTLDDSQGFHPGKAVGVDVTYMLRSWFGVKAGLPVYIDPLAVSLTLGAPFKFVLTDKVAVGGLDELLNIRLSRFAPTFYPEVQNVNNAFDTMSNTIKSSGELRVSAYGIYQYQPDVAIIGRFGFQMQNFETGKSDGCLGECLTTFIHAGFSYTPRKFLDVGLSIGFDDLAHGGTFAPAGFLAFRI